MTPAELRKVLDDNAKNYPDVSLFTRGLMLHNQLGGNLALLLPALLALWEAETVENPNDSRDAVTDALDRLREIKP